MGRVKGIDKLKNIIKGNKQNKYYIKNFNKLYDISSNDSNGYELDNNKFYKK